MPNDIFIGSDTTLSGLSSQEIYPDEEFKQILTPIFGNTEERPELSPADINHNLRVIRAPLRQQL